MSKACCVPSIRDLDVAAAVVARLDDTGRGDARGSRSRCARGRERAAHSRRAARRRVCAATKAVRSRVHGTNHDQRKRLIR